MECSPIPCYLRAATIVTAFTAMAILSQPAFAFTYRSHADIPSTCEFGTHITTTIIWVHPLVHSLLNTRKSDFVIGKGVSQRKMTGKT